MGQPRWVAPTISYDATSENRNFTEELEHRILLFQDRNLTPLLSFMERIKPWEHSQTLEKHGIETICGIMVDLNLVYLISASYGVAWYP